MRLIQLLETQLVDELYHGTDLFSAVDIVLSNVLKPSDDHKYGAPMGVSLTTDYSTAKDFSFWATETWWTDLGRHLPTNIYMQIIDSYGDPSGGPVVFQFSETHFQHSGYKPETYTDQSVSGDVWERESEVRIPGAGLKNVRTLIVGVDLDQRMMDWYEHVFEIAGHIPMIGAYRPKVQRFLSWRNQIL